MHRLTKTVIVYTASSIAAIGFNKTYALFSHGVSSLSMAYMWFWLLCLGTAFFSLLRVFIPEIVIAEKYRVFFNLYNAGTASLINGMLLKGIMQIAGATSFFVSFFYYIAYLFFAAAVIFFIIAVYSAGENNARRVMKITKDLI